MQQIKAISKYIRPALELLALIAPIICLIDCVLVPLAFLLLPLVGVHNIIHGFSDQAITLIVIAICLPSFIPGFLEHRRKRVLALMILGMSLVFIANFVGYFADQSIHWIVAAFGSLCLIKANLDNKKYRTCSCHVNASAEKNL